VQVAFDDPEAVAVDAAGNIYIAEPNGNRVREIMAGAGIITTVAGGGHPADGIGDGGPATKARLVQPLGLEVDRMGDLFIADGNGYRVRKVDPAGIITTVAGGGHPADGRGDGGLATDARLPRPAGVRLATDGSLYIADSTDNRVRKVSPDGTITTFAGVGLPKTLDIGASGTLAVGQFDLQPARQGTGRGAFCK